MQANVVFTLVVLLEFIGPGRTNIDNLRNVVALVKISASHLNIWAAK